MIIIGLDPGLACTGWGVVAKSGSRLAHVANGQVKTDPAAPLAERLVTLDRELAEVILRHRPDAGAVGHINAESGLGEWEFGQTLLRQILREQRRETPVTARSEDRTPQPLGLVPAVAQPVASQTVTARESIARKSGKPIFRK